MAQTMNKGPTTANERYVILDALRGLALLGIALAIRCFCNRRADVFVVCLECDARASVGTDRPLAALCRKRRSDGGGICDGDVSVVSQKAVRKTFHLSLFTSLAAPGRMALSNYISQSLVGVLLFYGLGFGLGCSFGLVYVELTAFAVFVLQIVVCKWWLRYFCFGPLEWVWRMLTYGQYFQFKVTKEV